MGLSVIPAQAGIQIAALDSRLRGNDEPENQELTEHYVDRRKSGIVDFHKAFAGRHEAPTRLILGDIRLQIIVDRSSVEVFINDGEAVISDQIFPGSQKPVIEVFAGDKSAKIFNTILYPLKSVWHD